MEYPAADAFESMLDAWTTSDDFGLLQRSHFQEEEQFGVEDFLFGSPYNSGDTGGSTVGGTEVAHQHGFGLLQGQGSAVESPAGGMDPFTTAAAADMANMAPADAQPELAGGLTDTGSPSVEDSSQRLTVSEILTMLRDARDCWPGLSQQQKHSKYPVVVDLVDRMPDPWVSLSHHREGFITKASNTKETHGGSWKERRFKAIRGSRSSSDHEQPPHYIGAQKTYEFQEKKGKGTKTKWLMHEYHLLDPHDDGLLFDEDGLVFRVILPATDYEHEAGVSEEYQSPPKRGRSSAPNGESEAWQHFTKIYNKAGKRVYAACHDCDGIFSALSGSGTSNLMRHNNAKHLQPKSR